MGHSNPKLAGGLKMKAFFESPYGDDVVSGLMNHQVQGKRCTVKYWRSSSARREPSEEKNQALSGAMYDQMVVLHL